MGRVVVGAGLSIVLLRYSPGGKSAVEKPCSQSVREIAAAMQMVWQCKRVLGEFQSQQLFDARCDAIVARSEAVVWPQAPRPSTLMWRDTLPQVESAR